MKECKLTAIVLAAGQGKRMNTTVAKQYLTLRDKPVLYYSLKAFEESSVDEIILVTGAGQTEYCKESIVEFYHINKVTQVIEGGKERYDSVYQGLNYANNPDYVLIHDGARPFITKEFVENIIKQVIDCKACIVGTPVKETIKVVDNSGMIISTPERSTLWAAQTPQAFEYNAIRKAYDRLYLHDHKEELAITDDAMVYETFLKKPVKLLMGDYHNIKITVTEDLKLAEALINDFIV